MEKYVFKGWDWSCARLEDFFDEEDMRVFANIFEINFGGKRECASIQVLCRGRVASKGSVGF